MSINEVDDLDVWEIASDRSSKNNFGNDLAREKENYKEDFLINCKKSLLYSGRLFEDQVLKLSQIVDDNISNDSYLWFDKLD